MAKAPYKHPTVFVGAPFSPAARLAELKKALDNIPVEFIFADTSIRTQHVLVRIRTAMTRADYSVFDITDWNPNVTLEVGLAEGLNEQYYVLFKPGRGSKREPPADLRGLQRIQYKTFSGARADSLEYQIDDLLVRPLTHPRYVYDQLSGVDRMKKFIFAMRVLAHFRRFRVLRRADLDDVKRGLYLRDSTVNDVIDLVRRRGLLRGRTDGNLWRAGKRLYKEIPPA
jgi:hypothetical protein